MFKKIAYCTVSVLLAVTMTGCSLVAPRTQMITINGEPANATVVVNGQKMNAPATFSVRRNRDVSINVSKKGYTSYASATSHTIGIWGILDIMGGILFLVPFIGLAAPGAYELNQDNFYYVLTPLNGK